MTTALVLGSGGARGWAHIGVLKALREIGFVPDICVGTSIGSIAAAVQGSGALDKALELAENFDWMQATKILIEPSGSKVGLVKGRKVTSLLEALIPARDISELSSRFAAVATDLVDGSEKVFTEGPLIEALRASISIPGFFTPAKIGGRHFVDGAIVNPLPILTARAMGAEFIVAVNINNRNVSAPSASAAPAKRSAKLADKLFGGETNPDKMTLLDVFAHSLRVAEDRMTLDCVKASPPDILIEPPVGGIATLDFTRAREAVNAGFESAMAALSGI